MSHYGGVPEYCSCGAKLVEDARFCHKCGAPVREEDRERSHQAEAAAHAEDEPEPPQLPRITIDTTVSSSAHTVADATKATAAISLSNAEAVRTAMIVASLALLAATLLTPVIAAIPMLALLLWGGAGYATVLLYRKRTGARLTPGNGARLGGICGLFFFLINLILLTVQFVLEPPVDFLQQTREQFLEAYPDAATQVGETFEFLTSPAGIILLVVVMFVFMTLPTALGGFIGARLNRE